MALMLHNYIDIDKLDEYVISGLVDKRDHPQFPLSLYCYGRKAVYDNVWDDVTKRCRGLIVNRETGEIIARPFEKFRDSVTGRFISNEEAQSCGMV